MLARLTALTLFAAFASACGSRAQDDGYYGEQAEDERADAREEARSNLEGLTYQDQHGSYGCTDDCSGHDAGYEWAQENQIDDAADCGGNSQSFIEGCEAYADDLQEQVDED